jgi:hypothetical protein
MAENLTITARITIQGPQAPLPGTIFALPVYQYEVVEPDGELRQGALIEVAHRSADVDDPGFAVGRLRRLWLRRDLPKSAMLWFWRGHQQTGESLWFCPRSELIEANEPGVPR